MANDTRERIVTVARDLVHGASLAQVSTEDVCKAAGVHKGSLYHFFPSKNALAAAVLERNWDMMSTVLEESFATDVGPLERIDRFVDGFAGMLALMRQRMGATPGCPLGGLAAEMAGLGAEARAQVGRILTGWTRYFTSAIGEARDRGEIEASTDPGEAATRLLAHLQGHALMARAYDDPDMLRRAKPGLRMLLGARPSAAERPSGG
ncbi:TetR/AcrR family transcriptional regulator [Couchioplanes azureus]|uniref:TetR/AcrR family transcriptional regulator n=1 Tax=Couchioplanes caeruleus TaxID=56438 RepID=UPI00166FC6AB|nr:TetR/AcrR family transcriptional regulator [Couchioplanes caeruleus]GGQ62824.1 TetR family transcriptional regulator [Couchioplanes caeruleus subsp. azureus]